MFVTVKELMYVAGKWDIYCSYLVVKLVKLTAQCPFMTLLPFPRLYDRTFAQLLSFYFYLEIIFNIYY